MVAAFDYCLHGKGGAAPSIDTAMHGLVDAAARRPPAPRLRHRARDRGRRRGADHGVLRRPGRVGAVAAARASSSASTSPRSSAANPQAIGASSAATASPRGARPARSARPTRWRSSGPRGALHRRARAAGAVRPVGRGVRAAAADGTARARGRAAPGHPRPRLDRPAAGRPLHRLRRRPRLPRPRGAARAGRARHLVPGPLPAHEGPAAGARPAADARRSRTSSRRLRELHAAYRDDYARLLRAARDAGLARRCAARTRRSCWSRASACSASARTSRPRGWPASSTSTRST